MSSLWKIIPLRGSLSLSSWEYTARKIENGHVEEIMGKANRRLFQLRECTKARFPVDIGITMFCSKIRPLLEYSAHISFGMICQITL